MKFSHSIQLNAYPEWRDHYFAYSNVKKFIYIIEKATLGLTSLPSSPQDFQSSSVEEIIVSAPEERFAGTHEADEMTRPLLDLDEEDQTPYRKLSPDEANSYFSHALDEEMCKITKFYAQKEEQLVKEFKSLVTQIKNLERVEQSYLLGGQTRRTLLIQSDNISHPDTLSSIGLDSETSQPSTSQPAVEDNILSPSLESPMSISNSLDDGRPLPGYIPYLIWSSKGLKSHKQRFEKQITFLFVLVCELRDYVEINETAYSKILKKYEKVVGARLKRDYMAKMSLLYPFDVKTRESLSRIIEDVVKLYARIATEGRISIARTELKHHLREHIVWERNTIWRDMIEQERRRETIGLKTPALREASGPTWIAIHVIGIPIYLPRVIPSRSIVLFLALAILIGLPSLEPFPTEELNNCMAILLTASLLWASEALPLFVTAICVPLLVVIMRVLRDKNHHERLSAHDAAKQVFSDMFGPVIMLLLGGFAMAGALSKHHIAKAFASFILRKAGTKPKWVLLANMFVSTFASMWISNVAAPVLSFSLISPLLRNLPRRSPYAKCLVMGIAMAANVGGMASPISSPQNIIAIGNMQPNPSWIEWFAIAIPICILVDLGIWFLLLFVYKPTEEMSPHELYATNNQPLPKLNSTQIYVMAVCVITIALWCVESVIEGIVGDMGVIAIIPIIAFYGTGILTKDDWNSMLWSVVMLAMGGTALGKAVQSSGLLDHLTSNLKPFLLNWSVFSCIIALSVIVLVVSTFISHTVAALILLPIIAELGSTLPDPRPRTMIMAATLMCSGGMGLPVSSFPNMNAISLEDPTGTTWLEVADFLKVGLPSSVIALSAVISIGYVIMSAIAFG